MDQGEAAGPEEIIWTDAMSVGMDGLDMDHKFLIGAHNQVVRMVRGEQNLRALPETAAFLAEYAQFHFEREEFVLESLGQPADDSHKATHRLFTQKARELSLEGETLCEEDRLAQAAKMQVFIRDWLLSHILKTDQGYKPLVLARQSEAIAALKQAKATVPSWMGA